MGLTEDANGNFDFTDHNRPTSMQTDSNRISYTASLGSDKDIFVITDRVDINETGGMYDAEVELRDPLGNVITTLTVTAGNSGSATLANPRCVARLVETGNSGSNNWDATVYEYTWVPHSHSI